MKYCPKCKTDKELDDFYKKRSTKDGYDYKCKKCHKVYFGKICKEVSKKYYNKNSQNIIVKNTQYALKNFEKTKNNHRQYINKRRKTDINFRLIDNYRSRINVALKGVAKEESFRQILGCSIEEFKQHLESQFKPEMNWENYGKIWEIDHIVSLIKGGSFNYINTQPLFKTTEIAEVFGYKDQIGNRNKGNN